MLGRRSTLGGSRGLALALLSAAPLAAAQHADAGDRRPNVLWIVLDDVGLDALEPYADVNPIGPAHPEAPALYPRTPHLASLASEGVRFTQCRVNPTCSTTRAALLSGRYAFRNRIGALVTPPHAGPEFATASVLEFGVGPDNREWTIAHFARSVGYRTHFCGKWHLALQSTQQALDGAPGAGWDHVRRVGGFESAWTVFGNLGIGMCHDLPADEGAPFDPGYYSFVVHDGERVRVHRGEYATAVQREAFEGFLRQAASGPAWLAVLSLNAAHSPFEPPPPAMVRTRAYLEPTADLGATRAAYCAMVEAADDAIGGVLDALEATGQRDRTWIFVLADNGTPNRVVEDVAPGSAGALFERLRGEGVRFKHTLWEPGIRVPLIVSGPGLVGAGRRSDVLVDAPDLHATVRELLGTGPDVVPSDYTLDGVSLLPVLLDPGRDVEHARRFSFTERFEPNGNPLVVGVPRGPSERNRMWRLAYLRATPTGVYKLHRNAVKPPGSPGYERLFKLADARGDPVDPWELEELIQPVHPREQLRSVHEQLAAELDALLRTEARNYAEQR